MKDEDFATAALFLFGLNFGEIANLKKTPGSSSSETENPTQGTTKFSEAPPPEQSYWGRRGGSKGSSGPTMKGNWQQLERNE